jgi:hypothetical protein
MLAAKPALEIVPGCCYISPMLIGRLLMARITGARITGPILG